MNTIIDEEIQGRMFMYESHDIYWNSAPYVSIWNVHGLSNAKMG